MTTPDAETTLINLLEQLLRLCPPDGEQIGRFTIRTASGDFVGDVVLPEKAVLALTDAVSAVADYHERDKAPAPTAPSTTVDPLLIAEIQDHFDAIDPTKFLDDVMASDDPERAAVAYEELVTGEQDGDL